MDWDDFDLADEHAQELIRQIYNKFYVDEMYELVERHVCIFLRCNNSRLKIDVTWDKYNVNSIICSVNDKIFKVRHKAHAEILNYLLDPCQQSMPA
jgi:hypothetical protein